MRSAYTKHEVRHRPELPKNFGTDQLTRKMMEESLKRIARSRQLLEHTDRFRMIGKSPDLVNPAQ